SRPPRPGARLLGTGDDRLVGLKGFLSRLLLLFKSLELLLRGRRRRLLATEPALTPREDHARGREKHQRHDQLDRLVATTAGLRGLGGADGIHPPVQQRTASLCHCRDSDEKGWARTAAPLGRV